MVEGIWQRAKFTVMEKRRVKPVMKVCELESEERGRERERGVFTSS